MPKQIRRPTVAMTVTSLLSLDNLHVRDLDEALADASNEARLRGQEFMGHARLRLQTGGDGVIRRIFSRTEIDAQRRLVQRCLVQAITNLTPERKAGLSSPAEKALCALERIAGAAARHDVQVGQIRGPLALLAGRASRRPGSSGSSRPPSPLSPSSPYKPRPSFTQSQPSVLRRPLTMQNLQYDARRERRLQLQTFSRQLANRGEQQKAVAQALFGPAASAEHDNCMLVASALATLFMVEEFIAQEQDQDALMDKVCKQTGGPLQQLFISEWRRAWQEKRIGPDSFSWAATVDSLVAGLEEAERKAANARQAQPRTPRVAFAASGKPLARSVPGSARRNAGGKPAKLFRKLSESMNPGTFQRKARVSSRPVIVPLEKLRPASSATSGSRQHSGVFRENRNGKTPGPRRLVTPAAKVAWSAAPARRVAPTGTGFRPGRQAENMPLAAKPPGLPGNGGLDRSGSERSSREGGKEKRSIHPPRSNGPGKLSRPTPAKHRMERATSLPVPAPVDMRLRRHASGDDARGALIERMADIRRGSPLKPRTGIRKAQTAAPVMLTVSAKPVPVPISMLAEPHFSPYKPRGSSQKAESSADEQETESY
jgi:hypothetical protein